MRLEYLSQDSQDRLEEQTVDALSTLSKGNEALLKQQAHLKDAQASAHNLVTTNLRELSIEKALIRSGHTELAAMASDIRNKLGNGSKQSKRLFSRLVNAINPLELLRRGGEQKFGGAGRATWRKSRRDYSRPDGRSGTGATDLGEDRD